MKPLIQHLESFRYYHNKKINKYIHLVSIPFIVFSILILLSWVHVSVSNFITTDLAWILVIGTLIYYYMLDIKLSLWITLAIIPLLFLANWITYPSPNKTGVILFAILFIGGWTLELIGHMIEAKKPALFDGFSHAFTAPLFFAVEIAWLCNRRNDLKKLINN